MTFNPRKLALAGLCSLALGSPALLPGGGGRILGIAPAQAQPAGPVTFPEGISLLQKTCIRHAGLRTGHLKISSTLPDDWKQDSELWFERPDKLHFISKMVAKSGETYDTHAVCNQGKLTIWASQPNRSDPKTKNVFMRIDAPADISELDTAALFGVAQFVLRLLTGEPNRLAGDRLIKGLASDQLAVVTKDGQQQDELSIDVESGLLKSVRARAEGQLMASGEVTYISVNQPLEPSVFEWKLPDGAKEIKPNPNP